MKTKNIDSLAVINAEEIGLDLTSKKFDVAYAVWIRALLQNWRQGTVGCKTRGEVSFSNKKPWKQKGTGRARAGSSRSPLWRSGGIIFGPQPRDRVLKINKKNKSQVLLSVVSDFIEKKNMYLFDWELSSEKPSTSLAHGAFNNVGLENKKIILFLSRYDYKYWSSVNNLPNVRVVSFDDVNAYDLTLGNCIVVLKKDFSLFKDMVAQWN